MTDGNYIQIQVPGVPYSVVRVELTDDLGADVAKAIGAALELQAAHADAFNAAPGLDPRPYDDNLSPDYHPNAPSAPRFRPAPSNGSAQAGNQWGFYCQQHNADLMPSVKNKTVEWDDAVQAEVPASWFHTLPDGKSCSVWRSKAGIRQAVGAR